MTQTMDLNKLGLAPIEIEMNEIEGGIKYWTTVGFGKDVAA